MRLKKIITIRFFYCIAIIIQCNLAVAQQICNDKTILNTKGSWKKRSDANPFPDENFPKSQFVQANNRIDKMQKLLQAAYPEPKGIEAGWYRSISGNALVKAGPAPYELQALFLGYYCNTNNIELLPETSTWFYIWANQFNWFADFVKEFSVKKQPVYLLTKKTGEINGYPIYEGIHNENSNTGIKFSRSIIITRSGQSPYVPVTQKQYLKAFLLYNEKQLPETLAGIEKGFVVKTDAQEEEEKQKVLASIEKNTKPDAVERRKVDYLKNYKTDKQSKEEWITKTKKNYEDAMKPVQDLLDNSTEEELKQPVIIDDVDFSKFKGFSTETKGGRQLVSLNPDYFDTKLPKYVPQFMVVYWRWEKNKASANFKDELEANFDFKTLKEMIDK
ncbi:MAG: hypothetical protein ACHQEB_02065 [Chitinophagales bacterium]